MGGSWRAPAASSDRYFALTEFPQTWIRVPPTRPRTLAVHPFPTAFSDRDSHLTLPSNRGTGKFFCFVQSVLLTFVISEAARSGFASETRGFRAADSTLACSAGTAGSDVSIGLINNGLAFRSDVVAPQCRYAARRRRSCPVVSLWGNPDRGFPRLGILRQICGLPEPRAGLDRPRKTWRGRPPAGSRK